MDVVGKDEEIVLRKSEKKKHKRNKEKEASSSSQVPTENKKHKKNKETESLSSLSEVPTDVGGEKKVKGFGEKEGVSDIDGREESAKHKNKKDKGKVKESSDLECVNSSDQASSKGKKHSIISNQELEKGKDLIDVRGEENVEHVKKGKGKKKKKNGDDFGLSCIEKSGGEAQSGSYSSKKRHEVPDVEIGEGKKKKKKKKKKKRSTKLDANIENAKASIADVETENNFESTNEYLMNSNSEKSSKRVKFASHVEVFPSSDDKDGPEENPERQLIMGKRFTKEEDQLIKDAVYNYIEAHKLGDTGLDMVLNCRRHRHVLHCWKEIGLAIPYRPQAAVSQRGHTLFTRAESRKWTEDEKAFVLKYYEKHGPDWKRMAEILGKNRYAVHDTWRRICRKGVKRGQWSQTEYQSLFNLVNKDLRMRVYEDKFSKHGMIRDNIAWNAIGDCLNTRTDMSCCLKWYGQLSSSMVKEKKWADLDDYRLLDELLRLDACCIEDVDWDNSLEHRSGDISLKRWRQMVNHIGEHGLQSFAEQVEVLAKRYCPELFEVRETLDSRPLVD